MLSVTILTLAIALLLEEIHAASLLFHKITPSVTMYSISSYNTCKRWRLSICLQGIQKVSFKATAVNVVKRLV